MAGRFNVGGSSSGPSNSGGGSAGMPRNEKLKLILASVVLVACGVGIAFYLGAFDPLVTPKPVPGEITIDGKPVPPEQLEEFKAKTREYEEANKKRAEELGPPSGS